MSYLWKLLRRHLSMAQMAGFFLANLLGMLIVMLSVQCYEDVVPAFTAEDGVMKNTYMVLSKRINALSTFAGEAQTFTPTDIEDLARQPFTRKVGAFTASRYKVYASVAMGGMGMGTDMFFESVPDDFVDSRWPAWQPPAGAAGEAEVPIIVPRSYLALYNFGFAQSQSLPKLSEGVVSMIEMRLRLRGEGGRELHAKGRVVGFSTRLNTVLVPQAFMQWSNNLLAPGAEGAPTRLIVEVTNPADDAIATYVQAHALELEDDSLDAGRATYFLKLVAAIVLAVGLLISALSFYILMLSIFLLVQKNAEKMQNLLLIGYPVARVALPYQMLTVGLNALVLLLATLLMLWLRGIYLDHLWMMFPSLSEGALAPALLLGLALFLLVSLMNIIAIHRKIASLLASH